jgi:hypothetical protein
MQYQPKPNCPLDQFKPCRERDCSWFTLVRGKHPQSEQEIDEYGCAIAWLPVLLIENAQMSRQTGAAVESFRNEMAVPNNNAIAALTNAVQSMQQAMANHNANIIPALINAAAARRLDGPGPITEVLNSENDHHPQ